jgi:hypothetical protein
VVLILVFLPISNNFFAGYRQRGWVKLR